jgi:pimeloyl-ACP methyl ester carboxylesterase
MPAIEVSPGVRVYVEDWGTGKPIMLVHGWPLSLRSFEYQMVPLAQRGYRTVAMDLRGFGQSDKPWDGNDYDTWADDIGRVMEALDLRDVTLAGFSMGGGVVMHYVAARSDPRVTKMALLAAAGPYMVAGPDNPAGVPREALDGFIQADRADRAKFKHDFGAVFFHKPVSPELARWFENLGMEASAWASVRGLEELRDRDLRPEVGAIRVPTRIFHGVHDQVVPFALGEEQQRRIPGATLVRYEGSGHGLFYDEKDRLTEDLAKFIEESTVQR